MYVAIAGNIGSGKTTLTEILTKRYGAKAYYEESDNPYIGDFYNDMSRWAFQLQISFLAQHQDAGHSFFPMGAGRNHIHI